MANSNKQTKPARKPAPRKTSAKAQTEAQTKAAPETVLVLRTCAADMSAHGGFVWPESGPVSAPDWSPAAVCGQGLHGLLWGCGDGSLLSWNTDAKWLVVEVLTADVVELDGKVKFPRGQVVLVGTRFEATQYLAARKSGAIAGLDSVAGYGGTATAGYGGTATAGDYGTIVLKHWDGRRYRLLIGYVGEDGIEAGKPYHVDALGKIAPVQS